MIPLILGAAALASAAFGGVKAVEGIGIAFHHRDSEIMPI